MEALQARQHAHQLARERELERELDQDIGMLPKRASPQSQLEKQKVRVHNSSGFDREAQFNW